MGKASRRKKERTLHPSTETVQRLREVHEERLLSLMTDEAFFAEFGMTKDQLRAYTGCLAESMEAHDEGRVADYGAAAKALEKLIAIGWGKG